MTLKVLSGLGQQRTTMEEVEACCEPYGGGRNIHPSRYGGYVRHVCTVLPVGTDWLDCIADQEIMEDCAYPSVVPLCTVFWFVAGNDRGRWVSQ